MCLTMCPMGLENHMNNYLMMVLFSTDREQEVELAQ